MINYDDKPEAPFVRGSDTSKEAAAAIDSELNRLENLVFQHIKKMGSRGATDDEVESVLRLRHQTISARRRTLVLKGRLCDSGQRRITRSGRRAVAWIVGGQLTDEGTLQKAPSRPSAQELGACVIEIRELSLLAKAVRGYQPSEALQKLGRWLIYLARQG